MEEIQLTKKIYKNIAKASAPRYYYKNISFIKELLKLQESGDLKKVTLVERNYSLLVANKWEVKLIDDYYFNLLKIDTNYIPIPILVDILFGVNYINNWDTKKGIKRLYKVYSGLEHLHTVKTEAELLD